jgi:Holliday junction resolvasome RuvABC endonuclease subunit
MIIFAIDAATKTGWCLVKDGRIQESGVQDFTKRRGDSNGVMFLRFRNWLGAMLDMGPALVAYERAHHRGGAATEIGVNLTGRIQELCAERGIEYAAVHTANLKKWACGHGKADKVQMMARAAVSLGRAPQDDNEADAVLIGLKAWDEYGVR